MSEPPAAVGSVPFLATVLVRLLILQIPVVQEEVSMKRSTRRSTSVDQSVLDTISAIGVNVVLMAWNPA